MAYQHDDAEASTIAPRETTLRRRPGRRTLFAGIAATVLAFAVVIPAVASWPVATRDSSVSRGWSSSHKAYDIDADSGRRIVPIRNGKVVFAGWKSNCGGYQVWVSHGSGLYSAYYHMKKETSWSGKYVTREETTLGYVGSSGCASGSHLHVEVWKGYPWRSGSYRVNPWNYIDSGYYLPYKYR